MEKLLEPDRHEISLSPGNRCTNKNNIAIVINNNNINGHVNVGGEIFEGSHPKKKIRDS